MELPNRIGICESDGLITVKFAEILLYYAT